MAKQKMLVNLDWAALAVAIFLMPRLQTIDFI
jgi:hypothetical protein